MTKYFLRFATVPLNSSQKERKKSNVFTFTVCWKAIEISKLYYISVQLCSTISQTPTARIKRGPLQVKSPITRKASMNYQDPAYWTAQSLKINLHKKHKNIRDNSTSWASLRNSFHNRTKRLSGFTCPGMKRCQGTWNLSKLNAENIRSIMKLYGLLFSPVGTAPLTPENCYF